MRRLTISSGPSCLGTIKYYVSKEVGELGWPNAVVAKDKKKILFFRCTEKNLLFFDFFFRTFFVWYLLMSISIQTWLYLLEKKIYI